MLNNRKITTLFSAALLITVILFNLNSYGESGVNQNGIKMNRLQNEKSPYLLQHADNPVDWYPWGDEAFEKAKKEDKPILLSIGYSTCHWCHVMEHESFEDNEVAALMNENFISNSGVSFSVEGTVTKSPLLHEAMDEAYKYRLSNSAFDYQFK